MTRHKIRKLPFGKMIRYCHLVVQVLIDILRYRIAAYILEHGPQPPILRSPGYNKNRPGGSPLPQAAPAHGGPPNNPPQTHGAPSHGPQSGPQSHGPPSGQQSNVHPLYGQQPQGPSPNRPPSRGPPSHNSAPYGSYNGQSNESNHMSGPSQGPFSGPSSYRQQNHGPMSHGSGPVSNGPGSMSHGPGPRSSSPMPFRQQSASYPSSQQQQSPTPKDRAISRSSVKSSDEKRSKHHKSSKGDVTSGPNTLLVHRIPEDFNQGRVLKLFSSKSFVVPHTVQPIEESIKTDKDGKEEVKRRCVVVFATKEHAQLAFDGLAGPVKLDKVNKEQKRIHIKNGVYVAIRKND